MQLKNILQGNYTISPSYHQIKLPLNIDISIPSDDPVRLVSAFVEEMNLSDLYETYDRIRKNQVLPRQMLKIVIYAAMNRIYLSRDIESACKRDINLMYLLEGMPAPDYSTIDLEGRISTRLCFLTSVSIAWNFCPPQLPLNSSIDST